MRRRRTAAMMLEHHGGVCRDGHCWVGAGWSCIDWSCCDWALIRTRCCNSYLTSLIHCPGRVIGMLRFLIFLLIYNCCFLSPVYYPAFASNSLVIPYEYNIIYLICIIMRSTVTPWRVDKSDRFYKCDILFTSVTFLESSSDVRRPRSYNWLPLFKANPNWS